jgi:hypothetical protein
MGGKGGVPQKRKKIMYCECGCGQITNKAKCNDSRLGHVKGQHYRFVKNHHNRKSGVDYIEVDTGYETKCWEWQLCKNLQGYGQKYYDGRAHPAHKVFYERKYGPMPEGYESDHLCRKRDCVNPDHIEPVTRDENNRRMKEANGWN